VKTAADTCAELSRDENSGMSMAGTQSPADGPLRPDPKRTESSDHAIGDTEIRRTSPRAIENQELMFGENRFRDYGSNAAWINETQHRGDHMDKEQNQIPHTDFSSVRNLCISTKFGIRQAHVYQVLTLLR
jgi:hypothetical protein